MGTPDDPHSSKHIAERAIEDGKIRSLAIIPPACNNTGPSDSGNYALALQLINHFHTEPVNDLLPAAESKCST